MKKSIFIAMVLMVSVVAGCMSGEKALLEYTDNVIAYSVENVESALGQGKNVVLNFRASRCPSCNAFSKKVNENSTQIDSSIVLVDVDYDMYDDLKKQYNVTKQHTFVLLNNDGTARAKNMGLRDVEELNQFVQDNATTPSVSDTTDVDMSLPDTTSMDDSMDTRPADDIAGAPKGGYGTYSDAEISQALENGMQVVYFFHASRCPSCVALDSELVAKADTIASNNVLLVKLDYDSNDALKQQYGINMQHSFVLLDLNKNSLKTRNGAQTFEDILAQIQ